MNGDRPKIEIFEPFGSAFEVMKRILFQPFDFQKWLVLGFAAFLSASWGNAFNFNPGADWNFRSLPSWAIPLVAAIVLLLIILVFVLMWIGARGRFIFTDCVVKNYAAIVAPWKEYRREGNSLFLYSITLMFIGLAMLGALVLLVGVPLGLFSDIKVAPGLRTAAIVVVVFAGLVGLGCAVFFAVVTEFMVAVMYRQRCRAWNAFGAVSKLMLARPGPFILYVLFGTVLIIALVVASGMLTCMTCCLAGLPYVSSVVLLPAFVWLLAFKLLFLRQFGPEYDVWWIPEPAAPPPPPSGELPPPADVSPSSAEI